MNSYDLKFFLKLNGVKYMYLYVCTQIQPIWMTDHAYKYLFKAFLQMFFNAGLVSYKCDWSFNFVWIAPFTSFRFALFTKYPPTTVFFRVLGAK